MHLIGRGCRMWSCRVSKDREASKIEPPQAWKTRLLTLVKPHRAEAGGALGQLLPWFRDTMWPSMHTEAVLLDDFVTGSVH